MHRTTEERLAALERSVRLWRAGFLLVLLVPVALTVACVQGALPGPLRATSLTIVNSEGREVALLAPAKESSCGELRLLQNFGGETVGGTNISMRGLSGLVFSDASEGDDYNQFVSINVGPLTSEINVVGRKHPRRPDGPRNSITLAAAFATIVRLADDEGKTRAAILIGDEGASKNRGQFVLLNGPNKVPTWSEDR